MRNAYEDWSSNLDAKLKRDIKEYLGDLEYFKRNRYEIKEETKSVENDDEEEEENEQLKINNKFLKVILFFYTILRKN